MERPRPCDADQIEVIDMAIDKRFPPEQEPRQEAPQEPQMSAGAQQLAEQIRSTMLAKQPQGMPMQPSANQAAPSIEQGGMTSDMPQKPIDPLSIGGSDEQQPETYKPMMNAERLNRAMDTLTRYKAGKGHLETRIIESEQWWKIRHWEWMQEQGNPADMRTSSAWLFNVIINKHADGIQSAPEANILPREQADQETAHALSGIIPCVLEENNFPEVYSNVLWQKLKTGTGAYGVFWDGNKLNGLGDIAITKVNLLHLFWEPGVSDIQDSTNVFYVEPVDVDRLKQQYPDKINNETMTSRAATVRKFITEDPVSDENKAVVVDWYYHQYNGGKKILHYCKFVGDVVLYATEDDPKLRDVGLYEHSRFPFVLDALFPVEASPCGFGYIDVCKGAQEQIDILNQALIRNTLVNAIPRYFVRSDGSVNEAEFMDFSKPIVHCTGNLGTDSIVPLTPTSLNGNVVAVINNKIQELKETSGNTDSSNGISSGAQAASAIAALQEASGKTSRAATMGAYRAFERVVSLVIELIRQFYDMPRQFRITGEQGQPVFTSFDNSGMLPQAQGADFGFDMGYRLPVFDIKVAAQSKNAYSKNSQNELALTLYQQGVFNPQQVDQSLMLLDMMDFEGKDDLRSKIAQMGTLQQQLAQMSQIALMLAQQYEPQMADQIAQMVMVGADEAAMGAQMASSGGNVDLDKHAGGGMGGAMTKLNNARERANTASQPSAR